MTENAIKICFAQEQDVEDIYQLLLPSVDSEVILPRSQENIRQHLANFLVARAGQDLAGTVALRDFGDGLHEIRSLAVAAAYAGQGLGSRLVERAVAMAIQQQGKMVFTLTVRPNLFLRSGFKIVSNDYFPQKVWADCRLCPKRDRCNEIALCKAIA